MTFRDWAVETRDSVRQDGWSGAKESAYEFYIGILRRVGQLTADGVPIYKRGWDVLVVLDACRVDLMAEVMDDYDFLSPGKIESVGSTSPEWMEKNFTDEYSEQMRRTTYVTGNPFSDGIVTKRDFQLLDEVWRYAWDDDLGTIPPDAISDRAITVQREHNPDRMIVHYMQPHWPFVPDPLDEGMRLEEFGGLHDDSVWTRLRKGEVTKERVWSAYRKNLEFVLESVEVLLENIESDKVVITSDHGNGMGEHGYYGHARNVPFSYIKEVPWCVTSATDTGKYEPEIEPAETDNRGEVGDRLRDLGYLK